MTTNHPDRQSGQPSAQTLRFESPVVLQDDILRRRIYSPQSYATVRNTAVVPIVHSECASLASWFPLVWQRRQGKLEFVAIRALLNEQRAQPPAARGLLPLILRAYPFVLDPGQPAAPDARRMLDDVFADAPTDVGATITTVQRKLSRGTTSRFRFLDQFAHDAVVTAKISEAVAGLDEFEPWNLKFEIDGNQVEVPDLLVVRPRAFEDGRLAPLLQQYGTPCAQMLGLHRISLFRAGGLLAMAKALFRERRDIMHGNSAATEPPRMARDMATSRDHATTAPS
ncbi:MAG: SapC family protein [Rhizobiales bacterium]|nr:SapC family protein [Hyphomicrobiales bacterium]